MNTFQLNRGAQQFYEFHDFVIARVGFAGVEGNAWANSRGQLAGITLADITYEWKKLQSRYQEP